MRRLAVPAPVFLCVSLCLSGLLAAPAQAQSTGLEIELNKFEQADSGACRAFFLFRNRTGASFDAFEMALAVFDGGGVIDRLLTIDAAPIPVARTTLKLFEIPETDCAAISEILLHDIAACSIPNQPGADCFGLISLGSRTTAPLVQ